MVEGEEEKGKAPADCPGWHVCYMNVEVSKKKIHAVVKRAMQRDVGGYDPDVF